jgi:hypothetical protein
MQLPHIIGHHGTKLKMRIILLILRKKQRHFFIVVGREELFEFWAFVLGFWRLLELLGLWKGEELGGDSLLLLRGRGKGLH